MRYIELTAVVPAADAEIAADALRNATLAGVSIEHPFLQSDLDFGPQPTGGPASVRVYVPADADRGSLVLDAREALSSAGILAELDVRAVADEDWAEAWKEHFHVERYGRRLVVVPSWRSYDMQPGDVVFTLDPGMAFGTGQHETTRMCLEALERVVTPGSCVLDVGCGSGILSIAAARLGAARVVAVDVDPVCIDVTIENAAINHVPIETARGSLGADWPAELGRPADYDVLVANIIAGAIIDLAPYFASALGDGGRLIASGIIAEREALAASALTTAGFRLDATHAMGEWRCLEAVR